MATKLRLDMLLLAIAWEVEYHLYGPGSADRRIPDADAYWRRLFVEKQIADITSRLLDGLGGGLSEG